MCQDLGYFNLARGLAHQQADPDLHYERARNLRARVEGPEQTEQAVRGKFQVQTESKLFVRAPLVVPVALLAAMSHEGVKFLMDHQLWRWKLGHLLLKRLGSLSWTGGLAAPQQDRDGAASLWRDQHRPVVEGDSDNCALAALVTRKRVHLV